MTRGAKEGHRGWKKNRSVKKARREKRRVFTAYYQYHSSM